MHPDERDILTESENQVTPFNIVTADREQLFAWLMVPLAVYARHEASLLDEPTGLAADIQQSLAFDLLTQDPSSRLVISCE